MAITIDYKTTQVTAGDGASETLIPKNEKTASETLERLDFNTTDDLAGGTLTQGQIVKIGKLKKNDIGTRLRLAWEAMGASATANIGVRGSDGDGFYDAAGTLADSSTLLSPSAGAVDVSSAGSTEILLDPKTAKFDKDVDIVVSLGGAVWAADKDLYGYLSSIRA